MAYLKIKNRAFSTLAADIISTATSLSVAAGEGAKFPASGDFHITIEDEILKCTAITTDTLTVTRAQEGTTAAAHTAGKSVELRITAGVLESRTTWTSGKLLKGAGAGVDPTEIDGDNAFYGLLAAGLATDRPVAGVAGRFYFSTDTLVLERDNGTAWVEMARGETVARLAQLSEKAHSSLTGIGASDHHVKTADNEVAGLLSQGLASARPAAGIAGRLYYSTDTLVLERDTGTAWEEKARGETAIRLAQLSEKAHDSLTGVTADQHHPQAHTLASHSTKAHSELTGIGKSDHHSNVITITFIIDGGGSAITVGQKGHLEVPFACTINQVTMLADVSGSIVVDIWKTTYALFPPADADSITASAPPTISAAQKSQDSILTGWTTAIAAGDILAFNVDSAATVTRVTLSITAEKS